MEILQEEYTARVGFVWERGWPKAKERTEAR
jgi:hypothetical protein